MDFCHRFNKIKRVTLNVFEVRLIQPATFNRNALSFFYDIFNYLTLFSKRCEKKTKKKFYGQLNRTS